MSNSYIEALDRLIADKSLLKHPFYQAWTAGTLSVEALADYAEQYYHHVAAFPTYLSAVHSVTEDQSVRRHLLANLIDEEVGSPNHPELWLQFAASLGVSASAAQNAQLYPETLQLIDRFRTTCKQGTLSGLAALYAYESQIPAVAQSKIEGLKSFYGISNPESLAYFEVHVEADKEHSAVEKQLLADYITESEAYCADDAASEILDALYIMLDGICKRHGIAC